MNLWTPLYAALFLTPSKPFVDGFQPNNIRRAGICQSSSISNTLCTETSTIASRAFDPTHQNQIRHQTARFSSSSDDDINSPEFRPGMIQSDKPLSVDRSTRYALFCCPCWDDALKLWLPLLQTIPLTRNLGSKVQVEVVSFGPLVSQTWTICLLYPSE